MIRPEPEVIHALSATVRQYPVILEWLQAWRQHELEQLPSVTQNMALAQGRCQVLNEVEKLLRSAPEFAAKSK